MSSAELKIRLVQLIEGYEDTDLLQEVYDILADAQKAEETDWWDELTEAHHARINQAISDVEEGRVISHEQMKENVKKWLSE